MALNVARHVRSVFHGIRFAVHGAGGTMPSVVAGVQEKPSPYGAGGISVTFGFGAEEP